MLNLDSCCHGQTEMENASTAPVTKRMFYGTKSVQRGILKLSRMEKELKLKSIPPVYTPRFDSPDSRWKVFPRQKDAIEFAQCRSEELHVFAYESDGFCEKSGQRLYLVSSYEHFWHYYSRLPSEQKHHYEVIPNGMVCHLYADLEFDKGINEGKNGVVMVNLFIQFVCHWLKNIFDVDCDVDRILNLDASTDVKFSRHLIFHLSNAAFRNNIEAGNFMKFIYGQLLLEVKDKRTKQDIDSVTSGILSPDNLAQLLVNHRSGKVEFFCDLGVYTKNRNFRLYLSSKLGKANPFVVSQDSHFDIGDFNSCSRKQRKLPMDEKLFLASLISNVTFSDKMRLLDYELEENKLLRSQAEPGGSNCDRSVSTADSQYQTSPYPEVDRFVTTVVNRGGVQGQIWRWASFSQSSKLVYDIIKNRWCENIQRAHKSNNIIIVVDLQNGIYYQKCHDPECRAVNFRSADYPLPQSLLNDLKQKFGSVFQDEEQEEEDMNDEDLLQACITMEEKTPSSMLQVDECDMDDDTLIMAAELAEESLT